MTDVNEKNPSNTDRLMTREEEVTMAIELQRKKVQTVIEMVKSIGLSTSTLESQLQTLQQNQRVVEWLSSFRTEEERTEAVLKIETEGLPPEIYAAPENIVEGPRTLQ